MPHTLIMAFNKFLVSGSTNLLKSALPIDELAAADARPRFFRWNHEARFCFFSFPSVFSSSGPDSGSLSLPFFELELVFDFVELLDVAGDSSSDESSDK
jgi:hypothetical protein